MELDRWITNAHELARAKSELEPAVGPYCKMLEFVIKERYRGACHAVSAILHVLLREHGLQSDLCMGELGRDTISFDHSWVEINGSIFDVAVTSTHDPRYDSPPVFAGLDLSSRGEPTWQYGIDSGTGDDPAVVAIKEMSFLQFMNGAPIHKNGLWHIVQKIGGRSGLALSLNKLRAKYGQATWTVKKDFDLMPPASESPR